MTTPYQIQIALHYEGEWSGTHHPPTFYVHAISGAHAKQLALMVTNPDKRFTKTSGSAFNGDEYFSWSDL